MHLFNAFAAFILLTQAALASPLHVLQGNVSDSEPELHTRDDDSECTWEDPWGVYSCDTYLITLGAYRAKPGSNPTVVWADSLDWMIWIKSHVMISGGPGKGFLVSKNLDCGPGEGDSHKKKEKGWDDHWTDFEHADLPSKVSIHGGHACTTEGRDNNWDNVWIEWSSQHLDVPSDKRCRSLGDEDWGQFVNCYVKM
ncbi:hypothetical protein QBC32DRAFT_316716 [Pseudoneurospora amorphoporcata]|uniref:Ecp2 effector protein domain-containing protein n=1 Tax=Pseudoneurospora amorphoporcata TaxID=241081 RepID=A0AAN6NPC9_9PEZI|nr:hypothetical protein QBC32DRAFT_316716 [Pseudoneurospora amorphoporcata]